MTLLCHVISCMIVTSNKGNDYLQNIGFAMEEVVLKLTTLGLATCWLECNIKREDILEFVQLKDSDEEKNRGARRRNSSI